MTQHPDDIFVKCPASGHDLIWRKQPVGKILVRCPLCEREFKIKHGIKLYVTLPQDERWDTIVVSKKV